MVQFLKIKTIMAIIVQLTQRNLDQLQNKHALFMRIIIITQQRLENIKFMTGQLHTLFKRLQQYKKSLLHHYHHLISKRSIWASSWSFCRTRGCCTVVFQFVVHICCETKRSQRAWPTIFGDGGNGTTTTRTNIALPFREEINNLTLTRVHAHQ